MLFLSLLIACGGEPPAEAADEPTTEEAAVEEQKPEEKEDGVAEAPEDAPSGKSAKTAGKGAGKGTAGAKMCKIMRNEFNRAYGLMPTARESDDCEWEYKATLAELRAEDADYSPHVSLETLHQALTAKGWTEFTEGTDDGDDSYTYSRGHIVMTIASAWSPVDDSCDTNPVDCKTDPASVNYTLSMTIRAGD